jgi:DNA-binding CsgD family transcriptional regulator
MSAAAHTVPADCPLTSRQFAVLCQLARGKTYKQIGASLGITHSTIGSHVHAAYQRLDVSNSRQAVVHVLRQGWLGWVPEPVEPSVPLSHFQRAYLGAFDAHLRTQGAQSRRAMRIALYGARNEAGLEPKLDRPPGRDPLERILAAVARAGSSEPGAPARG